MKKEEIENRDQELVKKFRTIINSKEKKEVPEPEPKPFPFKLFSLIIILIVLVSGVMLFKKPSPSSVPSPDKTETSSRAQVITVPVEQVVSKTKPPETKPPETKIPETKPPEIKPPEIKIPSDSQKAMADKPEAVARPQLSDVDVSPPVIELEHESPAKTPSQSTQSTMPLVFQIKKIIPCSSVTNRQPGSPRTEFSLSQHTSAWVWMEVFSNTPPFTLTHVYYCNGQKYCEVPLAIRHHRMRTWSYITLRSEDHIGNWRVDVVDDRGKIFDQTGFTVIE